MSAKRIFLVLILLVTVAAAGGLAWAMRYSEIPPIERPDPQSFDPNLVERGRALAGVGNCGVCHSTQGGERYAGGLPLPTPFGVIYSTNITPDVETGLGSWSEEAFIRAMREGVDRTGRYLYPAFPYDFFTRTTDEDLRAIYAYLMTLEPVAAEIPENELSFPFNIRLLLAGWNLLFLDSGPYQPDPSQDDEWNRGAYLVEGLGHCGACHSPRNALGAVKGGDAAYDGGYAEGWFAPPLNDRTPSPIPWTLYALVDYLIDGWHEDHGIAGGPMTPIVNDLYEQSEDDVFAMAAYLMSLKGGEPDEEEQEALTEELRAVAERLEWGHPENPPIPEDPLIQEGARVFEAQCATCHKSGGQPVPLALTTVVNASDPINFILVTLHGIQPPPLGVAGRSMPGRALQISDDEMVALATFVRDRFTDKPAWEGLEEKIREGRAAAH